MFIKCVALNNFKELGILVPLLSRVRLYGSGEYFSLSLTIHFALNSLLLSFDPEPEVWFDRPSIKLPLDKVGSYH